MGMLRRFAFPRPASRSGRIAALASVLLVAAAACGGQAGGEGGAARPAASGPPATALVLPPGESSQPLARVAVIVLENHEISQIVGNRCCPYLNSLASRGSLFTNYTAVSHPSLPNYLAMTSGGLQGKKGTDNTNPIVDAPNLFAQLSAAGAGWRAYEQTMPRACYRGAFAGTSPGYYALKHDPAMMFRSVATTDLCRNVVPWSGVPNVPPRFSFIVPNECADMHSCSPAVADAWLKQVVPRLLPRLGRNGRIVITWDEGTTNTGGGGRVATFLIGPGVPVGRVSTRFTHYGLLAALEGVFHLQRLGYARTARPLPLFVP